MRPDQVEPWISTARFAAYLSACTGDHDEAVALYNWNVHISAAFFEVMHHTEVLLRNAVDQQFPPTPAGQAFPISGLWLTDPAILNPRSLDIARETGDRIRSLGRTVTRERVVAGLSFGFWKALFNTEYEQLWRSHLHRAFPNGNGKRSQVAKLLAELHPLRNRIAHHEAIFGANLQGQATRLYHLIRFIDDDARVYISEVSRLTAVMAARP